jgi:octaprenyl-diphosphate synthase
VAGAIDAKRDGAKPQKNVPQDRGEGALTRLMELVAEDLAACNRLIVERMHSQVALIPQLAAHIVAAGGKRLRPLLTLAASKLCGYSGARHVSLAACVEFIHTATLLHDDVVDESALRRGQASANALFGNKASVLVGDFLFARAFQLMIEDKSLEVLRILASASATLAEGEVLQLITQNDLSSTEAQYLEVIEGKTASLFAAATRIGAVVADRPQAEAEALDAYGHNLGIAFQLVDDALDYSAEQERLGKTVGDDFREGKMTLPVLLAFHDGGGAEKAFWKRTLEDGQQGDEDFAEAQRLLGRCRGIERTIDRAETYGNVAIRALDIFPMSEAKLALIDVVRFCIDRAR